MKNIVEEIVYSGWIKLKRRFIDGKPYEILVNHDAIAAIVMDKNNKILLVEQYRPAVMKNTLEIPAGCIDKDGKSNEKVLVEELEEEAEMNINEESLKKVFEYNPIIGLTASTISVYFTKVDYEGIEKEVNDVDVQRIIWVTLEELGELIKQKKVNDGKTVMSYFYLLSQK